MGKSIRSKIKRANRTQLRKTFSEPIVRSREAALALKMEKDLAAKGGKSILALRKSMGVEMVTEEAEVAEEAEEERKSALPAPFKDGLSLPHGAMNPFGHVTLKNKETAPAQTMLQRLKEKAVKKNLKTAPKKSTKQLEWFK